MRREASWLTRGCDNPAEDYFSCKYLFSSCLLLVLLTEVQAFPGSRLIREGEFVQS